MSEDKTPQIEGASDVVGWFGSWPSFHDAEVLEVALRRNGRSVIRLYVSRATPAVDGKGYFVCDRHAIVTFLLEEVRDLELADFNSQNVISSLTVDTLPDGVRLTMSPCYGVAGYLEAARASVAVEPAKADRAT
jgi:hypothetical protein